MIKNKINWTKTITIISKIVPSGHNKCQLSIVNCQFGEALQIPICRFADLTGEAGNKKAVIAKQVTNVTGSE